ncbi:hypothetical protein CSW98_08735 [Vibrio sp. HA2012]|nr:hypothetical protein CSW98_08735 [Vibrio sp. HA2012]
MSQQLILSFMAVKTGSPISKLILLKLADNADSRGVCFPSCDYLARYCEISLRTVKSHIKTLEKDGFITRINRFDNRGRQRSNLYQLRIPENCHVEPCYSCTGEDAAAAPAEDDRAAHITGHKEKDLQKAGSLRHRQASSASDTQPGITDKALEKYRNSGKKHPIERHIQHMLRQHKCSVTGR